MIREKREEVGGSGGSKTWKLDQEELTIYNLGKPIRKEAFRI
jgi:hypothetical protein